jgi:23S rRNA (pseudouridine1915-N3)-methyltransferase
MIIFDYNLLLVNMLKLKIISVGKTKEKWLELALQEYLKRLQPVLHVDYVWAKNDVELIDYAQKEKEYLCLDPAGKKMTSNEFATFFMNKWEEWGSRLTIFIGGAEGLPAIIKKNHDLVSLSPLTFTHQITRLILIEQIYRAFEIAKGSQYHKSNSSVPSRRNNDK